MTETMNSGMRSQADTESIEFAGGRRILLLYPADMGVGRTVLTPLAEIRQLFNAALDDDLNGVVRAVGDPPS